MDVQKLLKEARDQVIERRIQEAAERQIITGTGRLGERSIEIASEMGYQNILETLRTKTLKKRFRLSKKEKEAMKQIAAELKANGEWAPFSEPIAKDLEQKMSQIPVGYMLEDTKVIESKLEEIIETMIEIQPDSSKSFISVGSSDLSRTIRKSYPGVALPRNILHPILARDLWKVMDGVMKLDPKMSVMLDGDWAYSRRMTILMLVLFMKYGKTMTQVVTVDRAPELLEYVRHATAAAIKTDLGILDHFVVKGYLPTSEELRALNEALDQFQNQLEILIVDHAAKAHSELRTQAGASTEPLASDIRKQFLGELSNTPWELDVPSGLVPEQLIEKGSPEVKKWLTSEFRG